MDAWEAERVGVGETTSRLPTELCDTGGDRTEVEVVGSGLIGPLILAALWADGWVEVGVGSSSASNGEVSGMSFGSRAKSSLKMFGFEIEFEDVKLDEEVDCREFRGDISRLGGCAKAPPEPSIQRHFHNGSFQGEHS